MKKRIMYWYILFFVFVFISLNGVYANTYIVDTYFTVTDSVFTTNERVGLKGYVYQSNYSDNGTIVSASSALANAQVNITIKNKNTSVIVSNYSFTTDSSGAFYSGSNFYPNATNISAPSTSGDYYVRGQYKDPNMTIWFSEVEISVVNQSVDVVTISPKKSRYSPSESVNVEIGALEIIGDRTLYKANVSINGTLRNDTKYILQSFNCTTANNGKCLISVNAPSTKGNYILELNNFKAFSSFSVVPFFFNVYMKDELGKSLKNIYAQGEQASVEVRVDNASSSDLYSFSGYVADSAGNVVKSITSTTLNSNNSFVNTFLFTVDALTYSYGAYTVSITVSKTGGDSMTSSTSFEVKDWALSINKKLAKSGFEYEYSIFPNKEMKFEAYPKYRINGSIIDNINTSFFIISMKDSLSNIISFSNATWNSSCGNEGCYEFNMSSPSSTGKYTLNVDLAYNGVTQTTTQTINVINKIMAAQSSNKDGDLKELFGTNDFAYFSLNAYNASTPLFNLSDAEIFSVTYMNGSEFSYTKVNEFDLVNSTNSVYEWAWNSTLQRLKLDAPNFGGTYSVFIFGNNRTIGALSRFIVNPYEVCSAAKNTPGDVTSGYYYSWQFKTTDTIYFEIKLIQANNPLGKASASNFSSSNSTSTYGLSSGCSVNTATQQVVSNATITVSEVKNLESGAVQNLNTTDSTCQASDSSGAYTCTVKPLSSWESGANVVKLNIKGQDGTVDVAYSKFETRAFYLYGWSQNYQSDPSNNVTLNVRLYEAGSSWWGSSGGLSGTISVKRVEYQGRDGEWIWPPVDSGYNVSNVNSSSVTSGTGTINLPVSNSLGNKWKTGYYRAVIQGTTSDGDVDYGYAWFGIKLWDVYGQPIECTASRCDYKSYFNSNENISLFIKISKAGSYNYNDQGGSGIFGNVSIGVKKVEDCRTWPCKELNATQYNATNVNVNQSSPWYWNTNSSNSNYILRISPTTGSWGTGGYSVTLNINGTDTGYAWFNTIAFYVDPRATDHNSNNYKYNIKPTEKMYYNVTTTKNYKGWGISYNNSDYVNATINDVVLRKWNYQTYQYIEYNYPEDINITVVNKTNLDIAGNARINISYNNGSWPTGYYWGELSLKNVGNETATGWLSFSVQPFRVATQVTSYNIDNDLCVNATLSIYEPYWYSNTFIYNNFSILKVYEDVWTNSGRTQTSYTNYTSNGFNGTGNVVVCPNNANWGGGSWGGYHYLNVEIKDNGLNLTEVGWMSFRAVPFSISWGSVNGGTNKLTNANVAAPVTITKYSSGASSTANLTKIYQWRYDNVFSGEERYVFSVGSCFSNVSGQCVVNGTQNVTIYPPSHGWRVGYNYLQSEWSKQNDKTALVSDYSGIYIEGREAYNGYFSNSDSNGYWRNNFASDENITIKLYVRNITYDSINANITNVQYAVTGGNCWNEWCLSYTDSTWGVKGGGVQTSSGSGIITIKPPSGGWNKGDYYIRASVSGSSGTATITGGSVKVKDLSAPNITIHSPLNNQTITGNTFLFNATSTENSQCYLSMSSYNNFNSWYCGGLNSTNSTNSSLTSQTIGACNTTLYSYSGSAYYAEYISNNYHTVYNGANYIYTSGATGLVTGGTRQTYTFNSTNLTSQHYGIQIYCYDTDNNYKNELVTIFANVTINNSALPPQITINKPLAGNQSNSSLEFNVSLDKDGNACLYSLNGNRNMTMQNNGNRNFNATNSSIPDGQYTVIYTCNDTFRLNNLASRGFGIDTIKPLISYTTGTSNDRVNLTQNSIFVNVSWTEINFLNITFTLLNDTSTVNRTAITTIGSPAYSINWTSLAYKNYSYNVSIYDAAGNFNSTFIRYINLSAS